MAKLDSTLPLSLSGSMGTVFPPNIFKHKYIRVFLEEHLFVPKEMSVFVLSLKRLRIKPNRLTVHSD